MTYPVFFIHHHRQKMPVWSRKRPQRPRYKELLFFCFSQNPISTKRKRPIKQTWAPKIEKLPLLPVSPDRMDPTSLSSFSRRDTRYVHMQEINWFSEDWCFGLQILVAISISSGHFPHADNLYSSPQNRFMELSVVLPLSTLVALIIFTRIDTRLE